MKVVDCAQGSPEWHAARRGIITASRFGDVMASPRGDSPESRTRARYMRELAFEIVAEEPIENYVNYTNRAMERGKLLEPEALKLYAMMRDTHVHRVGFVTRLFGKWTVGGSPDGFVGCGPDGDGPRGGVEIKTEEPHLLIPRIAERRGFPAEHVAQCQGLMWLTDATWWDNAIYWPKLPIFIRRAQRDDRHNARFEIAARAFLEELDDLVEKIRRGP